MMVGIVAQSTRHINKQTTHGNVAQANEQNKSSETKTKQEELY